MNLSPLIIQDHGRFLQDIKRFKIVRGDLYTGGIKCRVLTELLSEEISEETVFYSACYYGHSGFALGLAGLHTGKNVHLFFPSPENETYTYQQVTSLNNVSWAIAPHSHQDDVVAYAKRVAEKCGSHFLPIGFDYEPFTRRYVSLIHSLDVKPKEVWVCGGSGVSARCLAEAWPEAEINVINLNVRSNSHFGNAKVWNIPERLCEEAKHPPYYPSAKYYDAKMWQVVKEHAKDGALIWNIA